MSEYIIDMNEVGIPVYENVTLDDTGWTLHFNQRGQRGMTLSYPFVKNMNVAIVLKHLILYGVTNVKTGSLRHIYYKHRAKSDMYDVVIKNTEKVFNKKKG